MLSRRLTPSDLELGSCPFGEQAMQKQLPKNHQNMDEKDKDKCPFYKMQQQQKEGTQTSDQKDAKVKKQKKPKGGCPVMPSEHKRNPGLYHMKEFYDTQFVSIFSYMLEQRGIWTLAFDMKQVRKGSIQEQRVVFNTYPIYLKHTLFQDEENTKKMRTIEVAQRFFVYDKFREQGNKQLYKGQYNEAMKYYERALGCFKWLEVIDLPESESDDEKNKNEEPESDLNIDGKPMTEKDKQEREQIKEEIKTFKKDQKDFKKQYKSLMKIYTDENVKLRDPVAEIEDGTDKEMVTSMLFTLYLTMCVCYMHMSHFTLARRVLEDASSIMENNSQLMFRKSQAISYDNLSNYKQLLLAKKHIEQAIEMSNYEKIFKQEPGILRLMNLTNAKQMYVEQAHYVMERIKNKKEYITTRIEALFQRAKEIEEIEQEMIEDGKVPFEDGVTNVKDDDDSFQTSIGPQREDVSKQQETDSQRLYRVCSPQYLQEHQEYNIVQEMSFILQLFQYSFNQNQEQKKEDQVNIAKKELQRLMETVHEMHFYMNLDFIGYEDDEVNLFHQPGFFQKIMKELQQQYGVNLNDKKIVRRLIRLSREKVTDYFGQGIFNFEVLDYAMKDYFKRKHDEQKQKDEQEKSLQQPIKQKRSFIRNIFSSEFIFTMIIFAVVTGAFYYINQNSEFFAKMVQWRK